MTTRADNAGIVAGCLFLIAVLALTPSITHAHGGGITFTATSSDYFIDVDYEAYSIEAGVPGRFDFSLYTDAARTKPVAFSQVWVRIVQDSDIPEGDTLFSGWIAKASFGTTGFTLPLPSEGTYRLKVRYNKGDDEIVEATIPFTVDPSSLPQPFRFGREFWVGLIGGVCAMLVLFGAAKYIPTIRRRA